MGDHGRNFPLDQPLTPVIVNTKIDDMQICSNSKPASTFFVSLDIISPVRRRVATRITPDRKITTEQADIARGSPYERMLIEKKLMRKKGRRC